MLTLSLKLDVDSSDVFSDKLCDFYVCANHDITISFFEIDTYLSLLTFVSVFPLKKSFQHGSFISHQIEHTYC